MRKLLTLWIALAAIVAVTASSFAGSMMLMGVGKAPAASGGTPAYTYLASPAWAQFPGTSATFSGVSIGSQASGSYTIVAVEMTNAYDASMAVTVGGVSAVATDSIKELWYALTPAGGTGSIVVNNGATSINTVGIQVAQITNIATLGTPHNNAAYGPFSGAITMGSVAVPTNGIAVVTDLLSSTNNGTTPTTSGFTVDHVSVDSGTTSEMLIGHTTTTGTISPTITIPSPISATAAVAVFSP